MSQSRRTIEQLLKRGQLPLSNIEAAATHLQVYPSAHTWRTFFDKAALIIGVIALVLALVFFIAYNWQDLGKMGKFALVEGALAITIAAYVALSFRRRFRFIRQLLLLVASIITGSLLALFGQVYQTGADTWQLFFAWAVLISPWVIIARFPALWVLWLGLLNTITLFYVNTSNLLGFADQDFWQFTAITVINFVAFYLWLLFFENKRPSGLSDFNLADIKANSEPSSSTNSSNVLVVSNALKKTIPSSKSSLHWSTYTVALLSTYTLSYLAISTFFDNTNILLFLVAISLWLGWCMFMYWRFHKASIDLLMLTYLAGSVIAVVIFILGKALLSNFDAGGFLLLALALIGMSSYAVVWLRKMARLKNENNIPRAVVKGSNYE